MTLDKGPDFLRRYKIDPERFSHTGLTWDELEAIYEDHRSRTPQLESAMRFLQDRLFSASVSKELPVHSVRSRTKDPGHLIAKIIGKKIDDPARDLRLQTYRDQITDLIGLRVLHLFKREWLPIHLFIEETWDRHEKPIANIRDGDPKSLQLEFEKWGLRIREHPMGYRSIHYVIKFAPEKDQLLAEIQVRTLFEEAWSEIDHSIRYPHDVDSAFIAEYLVMFNRLSGSADEMGSFILAYKDKIERLDDLPQPFDVADTATLASILSVSRWKVAEALAPRRSSEQKDDFATYRRDRKEGEARIAKGGTAGEVLRLYYQPNDSGLFRYRARIEHVTRETSIYTTPARIGIGRETRELDIDLIKPLAVDVRYPDGDYGLRVLRYLLESGVRIWNDPMYRLRQATFEADLRLRFSISDYFSYRFTSGLLEDELVDALLEAREAPLEARKRLKIRDSLLPAITRSGL